MSEKNRPSEDERARRIRELLDDCLRKWAAGEAVDEVEIIDAFPDLHPELAEQLRKLRVVGRAAAFADDPHAIETYAASSIAKRDGLRVRCPHCRNPMELLNSATADVQCQSCGSEIRFSDDAIQGNDVEPRRLGSFRLDFLLGTGAFGAVWQAHDEELDRNVAIKIPRRSQLDSQHSKQFFREARISAQLDHPNIVRVHEIGRDGDLVYIVSDLVQGQPLSQWIKERTLTTHETAELCGTLAEAVHHAHVAGVVHRDLKPANIMMDRNNQPRIMDFGLAKRDVGEITMTADGQVLGTPAYMSPEQAAGDSHRVDGRSDVYSLGVILFEMLTGELPFRGSVRMLMQQVIHDEPPSPRSLAGSVPRDLETICLKCLAKERNRRYRTALLVAEELRRFGRGEPVKARPVSRVDRAWRWSKRNPMATAVIALGTLLAIAGPAFAIHERSLRLRNQQLQSQESNLLTELRTNKAPLPEEAEAIRQLVTLHDSGGHRTAIATTVAEHYLAFKDFGFDQQPGVKRLLGLGVILAAAEDPDAVRFLARGLELLDAVPVAERTTRHHIATADCCIRLSHLQRLQAPQQSQELARRAETMAGAVRANARLPAVARVLLARSQWNLAGTLFEEGRGSESVAVWRRLESTRSRLPEVLPSDPDDVYALAYWLFADSPPVLLDD